jgi:hypothetical protein
MLKGKWLFHSFIAPLWSLEIAGLATRGYLRQAADVSSELVEASFPFPLESAIAEEKWQIAFFLFCFIVFFCAAFGLLRDINNTSFSATAQFVTIFDGVLASVNWSTQLEKLQIIWKLFLWRNVGSSVGDNVWSHIGQRICLNAGGNYGGWMEFDVILCWRYLLWRNVG